MTTATLKLERIAAKHLAYERGAIGGWNRGRKDEEALSEMAAAFQRMFRHYAREWSDELKACPSPWPEVAMAAEEAEEEWLALAIYMEGGTAGERRVIEAELERSKLLCRAWDAAGKGVWDWREVEACIVLEDILDGAAVAEADAALIASRTGSGSKLAGAVSKVARIAEGTEEREGVIRSGGIGADVHPKHASREHWIGLDREFDGPFEWPWRRLRRALSVWEGCDPDREMMGEVVPLLRELHVQRLFWGGFGILAKNGGYQISLGATPEWSGRWCLVSRR